MKCARCGRLNPTAPAQVFAHGKEAIYCHGDVTEDKKPTCYTLSSWQNWPELKENNA